MCDKVQKLIDEASEEKDKVIAKMAAEKRRMAAERNRAVAEKKQMAAEIKRLKAQLAEQQNA